MDKDNELLKATDTVLEKGYDFVGRTKDFITCLELLLVAVEGFKKILEKYDGGKN